MDKRDKEFKLHTTIINYVFLLMCIVFSEIPFNPVLPVDQCRSFLQKSTLFGLIAHLVVLGLSGGHS